MEQLLLLRHADAEDRASSDQARRLTAKGREQAERVGRFCGQHGICPEVILTSPYVRAEETARLVATRLKREAIPAGFLASGMVPETAMEELRGYAKFQSVMMVGHEPDLSRLAAAFLGMEGPAALHVRKATLLGLEVERLQPRGASLDFFISVGLMPL